MFSTLFSRKTNNTKNHIVIDIGSGSVGAALVVQDEKDPNNFALTKIIRNEMSINDNTSFTEFVSIMNKTLAGVVSFVSRNSGSVQDVHVFLSSPWYASQSRDIKIKRDKEFQITKKIILDLINKESATFESSFVKKYEELGSKIKIIERKIIDTRVNGYKTDDVIGKKALSLEMSMYFSMAPVDIIEGILQTIKKVCHKKRVFFHSSSFSIFMSLRDLSVVEGSYLVCDIGAELSEVTLVNSGVLVQSSSFPLGTETFIKSIMKNTSKNRSESLSYFRMYSEGHLSSQENNNFVSYISEIENTWMKSFSKSLESIATAGYVPKNIYLFTKTDTRDYFSELLKKEPLYGKQGSLPFSITPIDAKYLSESVKVSSSENRDVSLMISSFYMVKYTNHHQTQYAENY